MTGVPLVTYQMQIETFTKVHRFADLDESGRDWLQIAVDRMRPNLGMTREAYVALCRERDD